MDLRARLDKEFCQIKLYLSREISKGRCHLKWYSLNNKKHLRDHRSFIALTVKDAGVKETQGKDQTRKSRIFSR